MENTNTVTGTRMVSATFEDRDSAEKAFEGRWEGERDEVYVVNEIVF